MKKLIFAILFSAACISSTIKADCCNSWAGWPLALAGGWVVGPFVRSCDGCSDCRVDTCCPCCNSYSCPGCC